MKGLIVNKTIRNIKLNFFAQDWNYCRRILNPYGKYEGVTPVSTELRRNGGLRRRVETFDLKESLTPERIVLAGRAQEIIHEYSFEEVCQKDECVAPLILWLDETLEKISDQSEGGLPRQPPKPPRDPNMSDAEYEILKSRKLRQSLVKQRKALGMPPLQREKRGHQQPTEEKEDFQT